jgi:16S rRNA (adenine1518-N6/adenine1519-N6)-dimethyltransferase
MQHRARRRFGQNFLVDARVVSRIVEAIAPGPGDTLLEIGPGRGALSAPLAASGAELHLLEIDRDLAAVLRDTFAGAENVTVHIGDALKADLSALFGNRRLRLAGNLPYNISTPLLFHVLTWSGQISDMHFTLQQEVVERMSAAPGERHRGRLSVMCQLRCSVTPLFGVPPEAFRPVPKVQSAVVRLVPHASPPVRIDDMARFERLVAQAFSMRRKTLRNALRGLLDADAIVAVGVDPALRAEVLDLADFAALANVAGA